MFDNTIESPLEYKDRVNSLIDKNKDKLKIQSDKDALNAGTNGASSLAKHATVTIDYGGTGGAGYISPLIEDVDKPRTYFDEILEVSSDGMFVLVIKQLEAINFKDSSPSETEVTFIMQEGI